MAKTKRKSKKVPYKNVDFKNDRILNALRELIVLTSITTDGVVRMKVDNVGDFEFRKVPNK